MAPPFNLTAAAFGDVSTWVAFSVMTIVRRSGVACANRLDGILGHYGLAQAQDKNARARTIPQREGFQSMIIDMLVSGGDTIG